ncbi:uncharacterized protein LOC111788607 [Cucurbita pepo subsp. pepo]|uniref:uncharacterized protein LOC111788607 n=1 Tax=Cucurbita pepo subsp. pepo TaxID=3664 RepID=UPI000C9D3021|nr:uncharacterized protein LOC111788607 [Cucurbita pepo subsp. pepo]
MENTGRTSSCLAISEKKTQKPGGCIGIFSQLLDWNRRLAKKKFFSMKLLPPARSKQATNKFKGGDKMLASKNHLITDENRGGFPNVIKNGNHCTDREHKNEMRTPGLVARLMGLESIPVMNRDRPKKTDSSNPCDNLEKKIVQDLNLGNPPSAKIEARPLKLRKTGLEEGKMMRRIGAEVMQYKSVMSRSRKRLPPPKFLSSAKSPRLPSGRNASKASRLIDVASKILEPGLLASNRAKSAITLPKSMHCSPNEVTSRDIGVVLLEGCDSSKTFIEHTSCKNWCTLLKPPPLSSTYGNACLQESRSKAITLELPLQQQRTPLRKHNESEGGIISRVDSVVERMSLHNESPFSSSRPSSQQFKLGKNESSIVKHHNRSEDHMTSVRDRMLPKSKSSIPQSRRTTSPANAVAGTKNFVSLNRNLNGCNRGKLPAKVENSKFGLEKRSFNGGEDFSSQAGTSPRKRRTTHLSGRIESKASVDSPAAKQRSPQYDQLSRTSSRLERKTLPAKQPCASNRLSGRRDAADRVCKRNNDVASFIINSPVRPNTTVSTEMNVSVGNERNMSSQKPSLLGGDALDILEQKLKELTSQGDDESVLKKPASIIIQELIAAVAAARKVSLEGSAVNMDVTSCDVSNEERLTRTSEERDRLSPGSILEASFSSSSMDESSGCRLPAESVDCSIDQSQLSEPETDLFDSANSSSEGNVGSESYNLTTGSKLAHANEVMLNAKILFGKEEDNLFINELETFMCETWTNFSDVNKEVNHQRGFLFDCVIEYFDSKHSQLYYCRPNTWIRTSPAAPNARTLIQDIKKEIKKWGDFVGMMTDEIVEWEMSNSLGKWSDFSIEELESGADIAGDILKILVEDTVTELWECRNG